MKKNIVLVSIIIPTFNRANLIKETLDSVLDQTYENWECIIVDDGGTDDTAQVIDSYVSKDCRFLYLVRPDHKKKGPSSSRNYGLEKSKGEYVVFLDSDDLLERHCLMNRLSFAIKYSTYDLFIFKTSTFKNYIGDLNEVFNILPQHISDENYLDLFLRGSYPFCVSSVFWKANKIKSIEGFDEQLTLLEDPELHIRAFEYGLKSKTCVHLDSDNFYRKYFNSSNDVNSQKALVMATYRLFSLYLKKYPQQMQSYCLNFYRIEIISKAKLRDTLEFYFLLFGILNLGQKIIIPLLIFYRVFKIENIRGLGFYTIAKKYLKKI